MKRLELLHGIIMKNDAITIFGQDKRKLVQIKLNGIKQLNQYLRKTRRYNIDAF